MAVAHLIKKYSEREKSSFTNRSQAEPVPSKAQPRQNASEPSRNGTKPSRVAAEPQPSRSRVAAELGTSAPTNARRAVPQSNRASAGDLHSRAPRLAAPGRSLYSAAPLRTSRSFEQLEPA